MSIEVKEICTGNMLRDKVTGSVGEVGEVSMTNCVVKLEGGITVSRAIKDLVPVELTDSIFDENFEKIQKAGSLVVYRIGNVRFSRRWYPGEGYFITVRDNLNRLTAYVKYVHQLQNHLTLAGIEKEVKIW